MLYGVDSAARDCNTDHVLEVAFAEALFKLLVDYGFHTGINFDFCVFLVDQFDSLLNVNVDALVDQCLGVGVLLAYVESFA